MVVVVGRWEGRENRCHVREEDHGKVKEESRKVIEHSTCGLVFDQKLTSEHLQEFTSRMKFYSIVNLESWE